MTKEVLSERTVEYCKEQAAKIYKADEALVRMLRSLRVEFGVRAFSRAMRQLKCERSFIVRRKQTLN